jgi:putative protease
MVAENTYELLAPAGDFASLVAAVTAGADSVYFGLKDFNMRDAAKNFNISDLKKIREICNSQGLNGRKVKMYLTLNTIIYDGEVKKLENTIKKIKGKVDAVICWDLSIINLCKKYKIPFHISTQASVSNSKAAEFYKNLGAERIVLARELSLKQIKQISKIKGIGIETFAHGAMCVSVSGRCFTSQFLFNHSANRGKCLHPCRRAYTVFDDAGNQLKVENSRIFSAKDLCTLPFIEKMKQSGIKAFKIEGRNREPRYVSTVVRVYRKALDKKLSKEEIKEGLEELNKVYNKGFSSGFYLGVPTADDFSKIEHSSSKEKKQFVGNVTHYFSKINVATIRLVGELKVGDRIAIIGNKTGIVELKIESMEIKNKKVEQGKREQEVGIKLPNNAKLKEKDEVYKIVKAK